MSSRRRTRHATLPSPPQANLLRRFVSDDTLVLVDAKETLRGVEQGQDVVPRIHHDGAKTDRDLEWSGEHLTPGGGEPRHSLVHRLNGEIGLHRTVLGV